MTYDALARSGLCRPDRQVPGRSDRAGTGQFQNRSATLSKTLINRTDQSDFGHRKMSSTRLSRLTQLKSCRSISICNLAASPISDMRFSLSFILDRKAEWIAFDAIAEQPEPSTEQ